MFVRVFVFLVVAIAPRVVAVVDDDLEKDDEAAKVEDIVLEKDEMIILKITTPTFLN